MTYSPPCTGKMELFFSFEKEGEREAKALCGECKIRRECLHDAFTRKEHHGVWAGVRFDNKRERAVARKLWVKTQQTTMHRELVDA